MGEMVSLLAHRSMRRTLLLLIFLVGCDGGSELYALIGCIPVVGQLLVQDGGLAQGVAADAGPVDAAGFFDDAGVPLVLEDGLCQRTEDCDTGTTCVAVTAATSRCLRSCAQPCTGDNRACERLGGADYCVAVVGRGEPCDRRACRATDGLACLPARSEGASVLAYTCQKPCDPLAAEPCTAPEVCLPGSAGALELQGGAQVVCDTSACGLDGGACACTTGFTCLDGACARTQHVCGTSVELSDPFLEGVSPAQCDPGATQAFCAPLADGGARVWCSQGGSPERMVGGESLPGVTGVCLGICQDPSTGTTGICPAGMVCRQDPPLLFHVTEPATPCTMPSDCDLLAGEECVGPLPASGFEYRCAVPYGVCGAQDGG